nr:patatin-like protein 3 [Ipomoea trifida]
MAFGESDNKRNYVRIQGHGILGKKKERKMELSVSMADEMLAQKNVESMIFQGKKLAQSSKLKKLDLFTGELVKEQDQRTRSPKPKSFPNRENPQNPNFFSNGHADRGKQRLRSATVSLIFGVSIVIGVVFVSLWVRSRG